MNDAKPTCGWNESKSYSTSDHEYAVDLHGLRRIQEEVDFRNRSEGTEPITAEWLIEKWGFNRENPLYCHWDEYKVYKSSKCDDFNMLIYFCDGILSIGESGGKIPNQPKTRDEFRSFAKWFGLEEK